VGTKHTALRSWIMAASRAPRNARSWPPSQRPTQTHKPGPARRLAGRQT
jgi:hypothetical protein